jgi:hypothetical protein
MYSDVESVVVKMDGAYRDKRLLRFLAEGWEPFAVLQPTDLSSTHREVWFRFPKQLDSQDLTDAR